MHGGLDQPQCSRLALARRDLDDARSADLAAMDAGELALLVERLRSSLHDTLRIIKELVDDAPA